MRIALLTDGIHPYVIGGMQKHSYHLAKQLAQQNHTVYLFHCNESNRDATKLELFTEEEKKNIRNFVIPFPHKNYFPFHYIYESKLYSKLIYEQLYALLPETDFIFAQGFCAWYLLENRPENCPPIAVHLHGLEMFQNIPGLKTKIGAMLLRRTAKKNLDLADYIISFGGKITYLLAGMVPSKKIWQVHGGIESTWLTDNVKPTGNKVKFVFIGRFERRKGLQELNTAVQPLLVNDGFTFDFIGDIPASHQLTSPLLRYHGKINSEAEIKKILGNCDVLVAPSYAEGMPIVIMEAMAQGLAIIATDVGAVSTLVKEDYGWLLPNPEPLGIANAITTAIKEKDTLQQKKENSLKRIQEGFLLEQSVAKLIGLMQENMKR